MGLSRSTYYDEPAGQPIEEARLIELIKEICAEWPCYGYRRVTAQLHAEGILVNHKKVMRLMREHGLTVRPRRRFVATTDSDHDGPIFPNLAKDVVPTGPNQLWVADIHRHRGRLRLSGGHSRCLVAARGWVRNQSPRRRPPGAGGAQGSHREPATARGLHPSFRSRLAICCRGLPRRTRATWHQGLDGPARQPLRQR